MCMALFVLTDRYHAGTFRLLTPLKLIPSVIAQHTVIRIDRVGANYLST